MLDPTFTRAYDAFQADNYEEAIAACEQAVCEKKDNHLSSALLAVLIAHSDPQRAASLINVPVDREHSGLHCYLSSRAQEILGNFDHAESEANMALSCDPKNEMIVLHAAKFVIQQGNPRNSYGFLSKYLEEIPGSVQLETLRAEMLLQVQTLAVEPGLVGLQNRAWLEFQGKNYRGAAQLYEQALGEEPSLPEARDGILSCLAQLSPVFGFAFELRNLLWPILVFGVIMAAILVAAAYLIGNLIPGIPLSGRGTAQILLSLPWAIVCLAIFLNFLLNSVFMLHPYGRKAFSRFEKIQSAWIAIWVVIAIPSLVAAAVTGSEKYIAFAGTVLICNVFIAILGFLGGISGWLALLGFGLIQLAVLILPYFIKPIAHDSI